MHKIEFLITPELVLKVVVLFINYMLNFIVFELHLREFLVIIVHAKVLDDFHLALFFG